MTFRTDGGDEDKALVRSAARRWFEDLMTTRAAPRPASRVRAWVEYSEAPGGAVIMFVPRDLAELERLRAEVREHEDEMLRARNCPVGPPAGIELARL
jgi:hypothetical protein